VPAAGSNTHKAVAAARISSAVSPIWIRTTCTPGGASSIGPSRNGVRRTAQKERKTVANARMVAAADRNGSGGAPSNPLTSPACKTRPSAAIVASPIPKAIAINNMTRAN
jgi:hypothetical protein